MTTIRRLVTIAALAAVAVFVPAGPADAATNTQLFKQTMRQRGLSPASTIGVARAFCDLADDFGVRRAMRITIKAARSADVALEDAGYVIGAGTSAFCPRHLDALSALAR